MEIESNKNILQIEKDQILNRLAIMFTKKPSSYGYKRDIEILLKEFEIKYDEFFSKVIESLSKTKRDNEDIIFITSYLFFMKEFIKLLKAKESYKNEFKLLNYLKRLASDLFYSQIPKNYILIKYGDKGDKAYINLNGEVDVIVPYLKVMNVDEHDYLLYLASLIKYKEYDLINSVLNDNFSNYPLIIYDDLTPNGQFPSIFENIKNIKKKLSTFIKGRKNEIIKKLLDVDYVINYLKPKLQKNKNRINKNDTISDDNNKTIKSEEQNENNSFQKAFKLNSFNEDLAMSLELFIIGSKELLYLFDFYYYNDNDDELDNTCSTEEYISRINAPKPKENSNENKTNDSFYELNIYLYSKVVSLGKGNFFGELALRDSKSVRTATIITSTNCHFAYLDRKIYNISLKNNIELNLRSKLTFFIKLPIFADIPIILFYKKYYTHISRHYFKKNTIVIKQGDKPSQLCLLNKGSYELNCIMNLTKLTELIFYFIEKTKKFQINSVKKNKNNYIDILNSIKKSRQKEKKLLKKNSNFQKLYSKDTLMKISEMNCPDITGFEEIIGKDGLYSFSLEAKTMENIIFSLDYNFYKELYNKNPLVQKRHNYITQIKLDLIIKRLAKIRNNIISSFFNRKTEDDVGSLFLKEIENINNQKIIGKRFKSFKNTKLNLNNKSTISFDLKDFNNNVKNLFKNKFKHSTSNIKQEKINFSNKFSTKMINKKEEIKFITDNNSNSFNSKNLTNQNKEDFLNNKQKRFLFSENSTYMNLFPLYKLRKSYKEKPIKIIKKKVKSFIEINNSFKGKKIDTSIKCYFDKKIKISDSFNLSERIRKKRKMLKKENSKQSSILLEKKTNLPNFSLNLTEDQTIKTEINKTQSNKNNSYKRLLCPKKFNFNMLLLNNRSLNMVNKDSFFHKNLKKLLISPKVKQNNKEKIKEIIEEDKDNNVLKTIKEAIKVFKKDDYYQKILQRIKLFYGIDKK